MGTSDVPEGQNIHPGQRKNVLVFPTPALRSLSLEKLGKVCFLK